VGLERDGAVAFASGDPAVAIYPRSSNKPLQAVAMVNAGLRLPSDLLALVCASHDGAAMHLDAARRILGSVGLDPSALQNTADLPLDVASAEQILREGGTRTPLQMNCSGKHSGMLATCVINGWDTTSYLESSHLLQQAISDELPGLTGERVGHIGIDGCGAPAHVMSLLGLARAFRHVAIGAARDAGAEVYRAMTGHPEMVGGARRDVTQFMQCVPGLIAKDGADGVFAAALPDGRAVALKIADGANRARPAVMVAALQKLGVDVSTVAPLVRQRILGHGHEVGDVSCIADFVGERRG
jgi:L-asparaginase II